MRAALQIASSANADLSVVYAREAAHYPHPVSDGQSGPEASDLLLLQEVATSLKTERGEAIAILRGGEPWKEIVSIANERPIDLIVVGTHCRRGLARTVLGSVAEKVVRHSPVPVLVVPPWRYDNRRDAGRQLAEALMASREAHPVVVALAGEALPVAHEVAAALAAPLEFWMTQLIEWAQPGSLACDVA